MTAAMVAMGALLGAGRVGGLVLGVMLDVQVHLHAYWPALLFGDMAEQPGRPGEQRESSKQIGWQAKVGERGAACSCAIKRKSSSEHLRMHPADRLEQPQVRTAQAFGLSDLQEHRRPRVGDLVHR